MLPVVYKHAKGNLFAARPTKRFIQIKLLYTIFSSNQQYIVEGKVG